MWSIANISVSETLPKWTVPGVSPDGRSKGVHEAPLKPGPDSRQPAGVVGCPGSCVGPVDGRMGQGGLAPPDPFISSLHRIVRFEGQCTGDPF